MKVNDLLSITIMTIPSRLGMAKELKSLLLSGNVPIDPNIMIDAYYQGVWYNAKKSWSDIRAPYHLVLQDDAHPVFPDTFIEYLIPIISILENKRILTLFDIQNPHIQKYANKINTGLLELSRVTTAQGILMSKKNVFSMLNWINKNIPYEDVEPNCDDERIALWQLADNVPALLPVPYLVKHICNTSGSSIGHTFKDYVLPNPINSPIPLTIYKIPYKIRASLRFTSNLEMRRSHDS